MKHTFTLSIVIPAYDEATNIEPLYLSLKNVLGDTHHEIIFVDDGSTDTTRDIIHHLAADDPLVRLISFSRNFGKESATTAGLCAAEGDAVIVMDADGQHPVAMLPEFVRHWQGGTKVVIGVRTKNTDADLFTRFTSRLFYTVLSTITGRSLQRGITDYLLIDASVQKEFKRLSEHNRMTRGLVDWMGFSKVYLPYQASQRSTGTSSYGFRKRLRLAANSIVSMSFAPLYFFGVVGALFTSLSALLGLFVIVEQLVLHDPWQLRFTGTAMLGIIVVFLVGLLLISQAITALYISHIHTEAQDKPLYIIDKGSSIRP